MHKKLGRDTARAADPNWPKGYYIPYDIILNTNWEQLAGGRQSPLRDGLGIGQQLHCASLVFHNLLLLLFSLPFLSC